MDGADLNLIWRCCSSSNSVYYRPEITLIHKRSFKESRDGHYMSLGPSDLEYINEYSVIVVKERWL